MNYTLFDDPEIEEINKRSRAVSDYWYNQSCNMLKEVQESSIERKEAYEEACTRLKDFKVKKNSKEMDTAIAIGMLICK